MSKTVSQTYSDDGSGQVSAASLVRQRLITRYNQAGFGFRADIVFDGGLVAPRFGSEGGSPCLAIVPLAIQPSAESCDGMTLTSRLGQAPLQGVAQEYLVDGGMVWCPFPASVYLVWPDKQAANAGTVFWSIETYFHPTNVNEGMAFTRYLTNGQTINVPRQARRVVCDNINASLTLQGGVTFQTGARPLALGASPTLQMTFLATMPVGITHVPVVFYYSL